MTWRGMARSGLVATTLCVVPAVFLTTALGVVPRALSAQEPEEAAREGCRCVDRAGEEIESCVCVVTPDVSRIVAAVSPLRRARLGVQLDGEQGAEADRRGVRIEEVVEGSPADEAGLRAGDVLVSVAGRHLLNPLPDAEREEALDEARSLPVQRLVVVAGELEPGEPVEVRYLRDGRELTTTVVPEEAPFGGMARLAPAMRIFGDSMRLRGDSLRIRGDSLRALLWRREGDHRERAATARSEARAREMAERMRRHAQRLRVEGHRLRALEEEMERHGERARELALRLDRPGGAVVAPPAPLSLRRGHPAPGGVELVELNSDLAEYFDVAGGVLVTEVAEGSELGLRPGDVVVAVGGREVEDPRDVHRILRSYEPGEEVSFRVVRRGDERTVTGRLAERGRRDGS